MSYTNSPIVISQSCTITQQPDEFSLSSMIKDFIIESDNDVTFELKQGNDIILSEIYVPDTDGKVYVRNLWKIIECYLWGSLDESTHENISMAFTVKINNQTINAYNVLRFRAYTDISASEFYSGNVFLNLMKRTKTILRTSKEYITVKLEKTITAFITYDTGSSFVTTNEVNLDDSHSGLWKTLDISFDNITELFPDVEKTSVVAIRIKTAKHIHVLLVDRNNYIAPLNFMFKNTFDVPETITTRGEVIRKGSTSFNTGRINLIETKHSILRADNFEVNSGKIFSLNDYDRYREMFNSEDVRVWFMGSWRKIIISEEKDENSLRPGNLLPVGFTFHFADETDNRFMLGEAFIRWILEDGKYEKDKVWVDEGHWNDTPS